METIIVNQKMVDNFIENYQEERIFIQASNQRDFNEIIFEEYLISSFPFRESGGEIVTCIDKPSAVKLVCIPMSLIGKYEFVDQDIRPVSGGDLIHKNAIKYKNPFFKKSNFLNYKGEVNSSFYKRLDLKSIKKTTE